MRQFLVLSLAILLTSYATAFAQPSPATSTCVLGGQPAPCQYRFRTDGALDVMTVTVTLLTAGGLPVIGWPVTCALVPNAGTAAFCTCCMNPQAGVTGPGGIIVFMWRKIGGRGTLDVVVSAAPAPVAFALPITFTSPDLNGSCQLAPVTATNVQDLGIWAACIPPGPYCLASDYNCNGTINILDLGFWAGGLGLGCGPPCP